MATIQFVEWRQALTSYESAVHEQDNALVGFEQAIAELEDARDELLDVSALVDSVLELEGDPIPEGAREALLPVQEGVTVALMPLATLASPSATARLTDPAALDAAALIRFANRIAYESKRIEGAAANRILFAEFVRSAAAESDAALDAFVAVVVARGQEVVAERQDAGQESLQELQAAIRALAEADNEELLQALGNGVATVDEVVRSSNAVRIDDPNSVLVVVNKKRPLQPQSYVPQLVRVNVPYISTPLLRQEAAGPLVEMFAAFRAETGLQLRLQNSYRSYATQTNTYNYHVSTKGQAQADRGSARPGHSEHQTGLALDVNAINGGCSIQQCFGDMAHGKWLEANAWRFGWIIRYPKGYEHVTGYDWEPWHLRYVGVDVSTAMHDRGIATLEEYFGLDPAPTY